MRNIKIIGVFILVIITLINSLAIYRLYVKQNQIQISDKQEEKPQEIVLEKNQELNGYNVVKTDEMKELERKMIEAKSAEEVKVYVEKYNELYNKLNK